jgi:hypothetical protein
MATAATVAGVTTFVGAAGDVAIAQTIVTTTDEDNAVSFKFTIERSGITLRVGTTSGAQDIVADALFAPGFHVVTFTPGVATYYMQFEMKGVGNAVMRDFARLAPGILELETPWSAAVVSSIRHTQSLNTMWFAGGGEEVHVLERRGQTSWSLRPFLQLDGPFAPLNLSTTTLTPAARTGTTTVTASAPLFSTVDVGSIIRLTHSGQFETEDFDGVDQVTQAIEVTGIEAGRQFRVSVAGTFSGTVVLERSIGNEVNYSTFASYGAGTSVAVNDELDNQVIYYRFRMSAYTSGTATVSLQYSVGVTDGICRIHSVDADNEVTVDVIEPFGLASATALWNFGAWSGRSGHPDAVALYDGRLWAARNNAYWGSASDNFGSFDVGPLPNQAISRTFGGRMSDTRWLLGAGRLLAGLSGGEYEISSNAFDEVLLPENVKSRVKTTKGSADANPVLVDDAALFISRSLERIYRYGDDGGAISTDDLTRLNQDIAGAGGFVEVSWQDEPEPRLWCVRADGQLAVLVFNLKEGVVAWFRVVHDGFVESVCVSPGTPEDQVHLVVRRTVNSSTVRYLEKLAPEAWDTLEEAWRLHCAIAYSGTATSSLSGLDHLEAREDVYVWANGQQLGPFTVASGAIADIGMDTTYAIAGLLYCGDYKSARQNWGAQMGSGIATNSQLEKMGMILRQTAGGGIAWGDSFTDMETLPDRQNDGTLTFDSAVQLWNEDIEADIMGDTGRDVRLHIRMPTAGPATVLAVAPIKKTNG